MRTPILCMAAMFLLAACNKMTDAAVNKVLSSGSSTPGFTEYIIHQGQQYCDKNDFKAVQVSEMTFTVKFDSTAIYGTQSAENQYDINKLYGFADNNTDHHQFSARFGWRWSDGALRLFAYVYNEGTVNSKELTTVPIGPAINCAIKVAGSLYLFTVNGVTEAMPRLSTTAKGSGYQLYPYFGGDEAAPHDIHIWIKDNSK